MGFFIENLKDEKSLPHFIKKMFFVCTIFFTYFVYPDQHIYLCSEVNVSRLMYCILLKACGERIAGREADSVGLLDRKQDPGLYHR